MVSIALSASLQLELCGHMSIENGPEVKCRICLHLGPHSHGNPRFGSVRGHNTSAPSDPFGPISNRA